MSARGCLRGNLGSIGIIGRISIVGIAVAAVLGVGCGVHTPERVQLVAAKAAEDPSEVRRLVRALGHRERDVWEEAYGALLKLGPRAVPALRDSVERRRPAAGRALLVLGEMGDPRQAPLLRAAAASRNLEPFARASLELCERHTWAHLLEDPDQALAEGYLEQFPRGPHAAEVHELARELAAWDALDALGRDAPEGALIRVDRLYGDTPAGAEARRRLAAAARRSAAAAIRQGRGGEALRLVEEARDWQPGLDVSALEAAARAAAGAEMAGRDLDGAIGEMEAARAISGAPHPELGGLYLRRARRDFKRRQPVAGMIDLRLAKSVDASLFAEADGERRRQVESLLVDAARPEPGDERVAALLLAGHSAWASLEDVLRDHLRRGDGGSVLAVVDAAWTLGGADERGWSEALLTQLLFEVDGVARGLLEDPRAMASLMTPDGVWSEAAMAARAEASPLLGAYVDVVAAALAHERAGGLVDGALPAGEPRARAEVLRRLGGGADPRDVGLPRLDRVQLLSALLGELESLERTALCEPARLIAAARGADRPPTDALEWAPWAAAARDAGSEARLGGERWAVAVLPRAGTIRIELSGAGGPVQPEAAADGLTALLIAGQPLLAVSPGASRVELLMGSDGGARGALEPRLRLALTRQQFAAMDWDWIAEQAPLSWSHLTLVPDRTVR